MRQPTRSRTYGRTGLKCQNGWHALCGMAPTLWSSNRHVDRRGNIARRERLCLWVLCVVSAGRYALFKNSIECTVDVHETRVIGIRGVWAGAAPRGRARARIVDRERWGWTSAPSGGVAAPVDVVLDPALVRTRHAPRPRGVDASVRPGPRTPPDITRPVKVSLSVESVRLTDNILYSKCLLVISFKTLHQRFHHALER
jgi:hypothetical protein